MKCLILGANGFIGKHLADELLKRNHQVSAFDRNFDETINSNKQINKIIGDYNSDYDFETLLDNQDVVFHLISTTIPNSQKQITQEIQENIFPTLKLLDACVKKKIKKVVFISSGGTVYGQSKGVPFRENDETTPICAYGIQKLTIEKYLNLYFHKFNLDYSVIRLANPYGPGQNPKGAVGAVSVFLYKALKNEKIVIYGNGNSVRDYIYIDDAVKAIVNVSEFTCDQKVFNIGSGTGYSLNQLIEIIESILGHKLDVDHQEVRESDLDYNVLDITSYKNRFPHHEMITLEEGISNLKYYLEKYYKE